MISHLLQFTRFQVKYVWLSPWSLGKLLYFVNRYLPFIDIFTLIHCASVLAVCRPAVYPSPLVVTGHNTVKVRSIAQFYTTHFDSYSSNAASRTGSSHVCVSSSVFFLLNDLSVPLRANIFLHLDSPKYCHISAPPALLTHLMQ